MQKILVINGHPNPEASVAGKAVLNTLESSRCEMQIERWRSCAVPTVLMWLRNKRLYGGPM